MENRFGSLFSLFLHIMNTVHDFLFVDRTSCIVIKIKYLLDKTVLSNVHDVCKGFYRIHKQIQTHVLCNIHIQLGVNLSAD